MSEGVLREVTLALPMVAEMEIEASKTAAAIAESIRMSPDRIDEVRLAVVEACINALEHSQAVDREVFVTFQVVGERDPEKLRIMVHDNGIGFDPEEGPIGPGPIVPRSGGPSGGLLGGLQGKLQKRRFGLKIIRGLMDEVEIRSGTEGTTVVMSKLR